MRRAVRGVRAAVRRARLRRRRRLDARWAAAAVVAALVAGGLLIAVMRYRSLTDLVAEADRLPSWPWLLAVTGAMLCVVAVAALLEPAARRRRPALAARRARRACSRPRSTPSSYVIGWAGAGLARALQWVLGLLHVRAPHLELKPPPAARVKVVVPPYQPAAPGSSPRDWS